jgi:hypothetical protein
MIQQNHIIFQRYINLKKNSGRENVKKRRNKEMSSDIKGWLLKQDAHTLHRTVRKRFPRKP